MNFAGQVREGELPVRHEAVDQDLRFLAARAEPPLRPAICQALAGGKRSRALLLLAGGQGSNLQPGTLLRAAACVELLHAATLVQDDIFDESRVRRGQPALHCSYTPQLATLASDWMLAEALRAAYSLHPGFGEALATCSQRMMAGEAREIAMPTQRTLGARREHARSIAADKTGELFGLVLSAARLLGSDLAQSNRLHLLGRELGVAFQYLDDTLDLYGDQRTAGKEVERDQALGLCTSPVLDAIGMLSRAAAASVLSLRGGLAPGVLDELRSEEVRSCVLARARRQWETAAGAVLHEFPSGSVLSEILSAIPAAMLPDPVASRSLPRTGAKGSSAAPHLPF